MGEEEGVKENGSVHPSSTEVASEERQKMLPPPVEMEKLNGEKERRPEYTRMLTSDLEDMFKDMPLTEETTCGWGVFRGAFLQRFANKKAFVCLYGVVGCMFSATYAYFNGTITTLEKRYKIPSRNTGFISVGNDIASIFLSAALSYYAGKGHRPRWIAFGTSTIVIFCLMNVLPHFLYGPGEAALSLTEEYGAQAGDNQTAEVIEREKRKELCKIDGLSEECEVAEGNFAPQVILFVAQLISGIGASLYYALGASYMDDNIQKSKTPALISFSYFLRMLGPASGYALASYCLKHYISPTYKPTITTSDPRWLGAWWIGWLVLAGAIGFFTFFLSLFPQTLPRAAVRRQMALERKRRGEKVDEIEEEKPSLADMFVTFKRLLRNNVYMLNNLASVFYFFGFMPYWIFTPKYIETQYKQSASVSSLVTGTVALVFSAIGVLLSGIIISRYKPKARWMAAWNVAVGAFSVFGMVGYVFLGCSANENAVVLNAPEPGITMTTCNSACRCDYVKYSPVCGEDGLTYISPCHAGCREVYEMDGGSKIFADCSCIEARNGTIASLLGLFNETVGSSRVARDFSGGFATPSSCPIDCFREFVLFLIVMCLIKFCGATGRASNFLVGVRCVDEKDKAVSMGFGMMLMCLFAFIPSPIFFGSLLDRTCLLWGKTCSGKGNCWLYDNETLRIWLNLIAAAFVTLGTLFDVGVWYYVKDLKIFDEEIKDEDYSIAEEEEERIVEQPR